MKKSKKTDKCLEIGRILVPGALNDTKKIRKAGANIFTNIGPAKIKKLKWTQPNTQKELKIKKTKNKF